MTPPINRKIDSASVSGDEREFSGDEHRVRADESHQCHEPENRFQTDTILKGSFSPRRHTAGKRQETD